MRHFFQSCRSDAGHRSYACLSEGCCLVQQRHRLTNEANDGGVTPHCPVREVSWEMFASVRQTADTDPCFAGCRHHIIRHLHRYTPKDLAAFMCAFARADNTNSNVREFFRRLLWRIDRLVPQLSGHELLTVLESSFSLGLREHDPRRPDLVRVAAAPLAAAANHFGARDISRVAALCRLVGLRDAQLFNAMGARLELLLRDKYVLTRTSKTSGVSKQRKVRPPVLAGGHSAAVMTFLAACGRLNIACEQSAFLFDVVSPGTRKSGDVGKMAALAQLAAKLDLGGTCQEEVNAIYSTVRASLVDAVAAAGAAGVAAVGTESRKRLPRGGSSSPHARGYASQVVYGQLLLALVFDEAASAERDSALIAAINAARASFGASLAALDERLARQLSIADLACRLERPDVLQKLEEEDLMSFLRDVKDRDAHQEESAASQRRGLSALTKISSQQHLQVSGALQDLSVDHRSEERLLPYVADVRVRGGRRLIEIDGPMHFVGETNRYDLKSTLKHRLLTKQGWQVHHIAWNDWPVRQHTRMNYLRKLLRSPPPPASDMREYRPLSPTD